jgi:hypothetical protein
LTLRTTGTTFPGMSEYRVEKVRRRVALVLRNGERIEGEVFLRPVSRHRSRPESPADLLNDDDPFFALDRDGEAFLLAKDGVASAETNEDEDDLQDLETSALGASLGVPVEVTMRDGTVCTGSIFLESRSDRPRLLDFLNRYQRRFLPVVGATQVTLINTQTIAHVREVA